ncbi:hypothetical protein [Moraxella cuniculi]|nr:hypothetical protein [Moraxella cuniculi]
MTDFIIAALTNALQILQVGNQVIFDYLLFDEKCGNLIKNSTDGQLT